MNVPANVVVIVGGGVSGLTAAVQLARSGIPSVLFDETSQLGGRAQTHRRDGFCLNYGPHRLYAGGAAVETFRALGIPIDAAQRGPNGGLAVWRGRRYTLPVGFCSLLTTDLFSAYQKRQVAKFMTALPARPVDALDRVPIGEWLRTELTDADVIEFMLALVRYATYSGNPEDLSATAAIDQLRLSTSGAVLYVHYGWATLVANLRDAAIAGGGTIVPRRRVVRVNAINRRAVSVTLDDGTTIPSAALIVATAPTIARRLFDDSTPFDAPSAPVRVAALDVALRALADRRSVFAVAIDEPWCFSADSAIAHVAPDGAGVVHLAKCLHGAEVGTPSDEQDLERALDLLQPGWRHLVIRRRFFPSLVVSHAIVSADAGGLAGRPSGRVPGISNVFLAGDWIGPTGQLIDASVASAVSAARHVAQFLARESNDDGPL